MRRRLLLAFTAAMTVLGTVAGLPAQAAAPLRVRYDWTSGFPTGLPLWKQAPPGAITYDAKGKLASCSSPGKLPVILVHGTWENQNDNWRAAAPLLHNAGFCVYTFNYGGAVNDVFMGTGPIATSADQLGVFVDAVRAATGSEQVDLVGHSQGGMMPRYYIKFGNSFTGGKFAAGTSKIRKLIGLAPSNHGTTLSGIADLGKLLGLLPAVAAIQPAAIDQTIGSPFNNKLNTCPNGLPAADVCAGDPVQYTMIATKYDEVVTPYGNSFLAANPAAPATVTNIRLQDGCKLDQSEHLSVVYDSYAYGVVLKALGVDPKKVAGASPSCKLVLPLVGG